MSINYAWKFEGVAIPDNVVVKASDQTVVLEGTATCEREGRDDRPETVFWEASVTPRGWAVVVRQGTGRATMWEGPTFNLFLEVAAAVRRH